MIIIKLLQLRKKQLLKLLKKYTGAGATIFLNSQPYLLATDFYVCVQPCPWDQNLTNYGVNRRKTLMVKPQNTLYDFLKPMFQEMKYHLLNQKRK